MIRLDELQKAEGLAVWVDESESEKNLLVVGGIIAKWSATADIVKDWRRMKIDFGLSDEDEVKWNLPIDHPTRRSLESSRFSTSSLRQKAIHLISSRDDLLCIVAVMLENRKLEWWKRIWRKVSVRDFYCEGLRYIIQRVVEEVVESKASSCVVVCDTPELGNKKFEQGKIRRGPKAVEEIYKEWYKNGVDVGPSRKIYQGSLQEIGMHPSILIGDATYHDMLQIADIVAGITRDWVTSILNKKPQDGVTRLMKSLSKRLRARYGSPDFWGDGLIIWPPQNNLLFALQENLQG